MLFSYFNQLKEELNVVKKRKKILTRLFPAAGLFIGIGIGLIMGNPGSGTLIGLGVGILASIVYIIQNKK